MIKKMIMVTMILALLTSMIGIASAEDITILPVGNPIDVPMDPNPISPPVSVVYTGWTAGTSTYTVSVYDGATPLIGTCIVSGTITSDPQTVTLPGCKIPTSLAGKEVTIEAKGKCPLGGCTDVTRGKTLYVDASLNPVPELSTGILVATGIIGLLGIVRLRRKD